MPMHADTQTTTLAVSAEDAFAFLAQPENLPRWAVGFARGIRREGDDWIVQTAQGEMPVRVCADATRGTIDFHMRVAPGLEAIAYSRVVPNDSGAEYVFTQFQLPGIDRKSTRLNSSHGYISYAVFCLKKKKNNK